MRDSLSLRMDQTQSNPDSWNNNPIVLDTDIVMLSGVTIQVVFLCVESFRHWYYIFLAYQTGFSAVFTSARKSHLTPPDVFVKLAFVLNSRH